jgi:hypothetical protein
MKYKILNEFENSKELNPEDGSVLIFMFSEIKIYKDGRKYKRLIDLKILKDFNETDNLIENIDFLKTKRIISKHCYKWKRLKTTLSQIQ